MKSRARGGTYQKANKFPAHWQRFFCGKLSVGVPKIPLVSIIKRETEVIATNGEGKFMAESYLLHAYDAFDR